MIAVDTNVIVRFLVRDDERQAEAVRKRLKQAEERRERLKIPLLVVLETIWVLESAYEKTRSEILGSIEDMRQMPVFEFEADRVIEGLLNDGPKYNTDLADILIGHAAETSGCDAVITFDKGAAKLPFFSILK
ncbi:MAG TPA: type II toxin-antitoxin system VapC family toxin [Kiritimatiellia bacterium]|nr:type II toxin-antitoxin system VapC family toxin [Kiritimatiellia bacterium]HMO98454.1 type II toxin-antitoxin system VapC family toxin [Kiritimatiellia bacterium]HMP95872.1 type II toxin-antitoxin system VapC family toxin [Kiritimatiellia bacterium]